MFSPLPPPQKKNIKTIIDFFPRPHTVPGVARAEHPDLRVAEGAQEED